MSNLTAIDYYKYAALSTAAYVRMGSKSLDGKTFADQAALPAQAGGRLPLEQAQYLFDPANQYGAPVWNVLSYYGDDIPASRDPLAAADKSGFGATLFDRTQNGQTEKVLALRGTEGVDYNDLVINGLGGIGLLGLALPQVVSMVNLIQRLKGSESSPVLQLRINSSLTDPGVPSVRAEGTFGSSVYFSFGFYAAPGLGLLKYSDKVTVTGHSLGGHLAIVAARLFPQLINQDVYVYNSAGIDSTSANFAPELVVQAVIATLAQKMGAPVLNLRGVPQTLSDELITLIGRFLSAPAASDLANFNVHNVRSEDLAPEDDISLVASFVTGAQHLGPEISVTTESNNHIIEPFMDALALQALIEPMKGGAFAANHLVRVLEASSNNLAHSYEGFAENLYQLFLKDEKFLDEAGARERSTLPTSNEASAFSVGKGTIGQRNAFHDAVLRIQEAIKGKTGLQLVSLADMTGDSLKNLAINGDLDAMAYRYAVKELNPFAVLGPDSLYAPHNANGELNPFADAATTPAAMTTAYITDRAQMVAFLATANTNDTNAFGSNQVSDQVLYQDLIKRPAPESLDGKPTEVLVFLPSGTPNFRGPNTRVVGFGTDSTDVLQGRDNTDRLYGGRGADLLQGGKNDDYLEGGAGLDVYSYSSSNILFTPSNDANDTIRDTDGKGVLRYVYQDGLLATPKTTVIGGLGIKLTPAQWQSPDGKFTYDQQGSNGLLVTVNGDAGGSIMIRDFDYAKAASEGNLGVHLVDGRLAPQAPQTSRDIEGDRALLITTANVPAILVQHVNPDGSLGGFIWVPQVEPNWTQIEVLETYVNSENDPVSYDIRYKQFDDVDNLVRTLQPQAGFADSFNDSSGADHIITGGGNDTVTAFRGGDDVIETGDGNDIAWGGAGNDWIDGGATNDTLLGEAGDDFVTGGAHRDIVEGGEGSDWLEGEADADIVAGGVGDDAIFGGTGRDASGQAYGLAFLVAAGQTASATPGQGELLDGGAGKDLLVGAASADQITAGEGDDLMLGGAGDDTIYGDASIPSASLNWFVLRQMSIFNGMRVYEVLHSFNTEFVSDPAVGGADVIYGGAGEDWIFGGAGDDYIDGGDSLDDANVTDDVLFGDAGSDILVGGSGKDFLSGDSSLSDEAGLSGDDYLLGGAGDDELVGGQGNDIVDGSTGDDTLSGGEGDDILWGGPGTDVMVGGAGKDTYVFNRGDGVEVVQDVPATGTASDASVLALGDGIARSQVKFRLGSLMIDLGEGDAIHFDGFNPDNPFDTPVLDSIQFADGEFMTYQDVLDQGFDLDGTEGDDYIKGTAVTDRIDAKGGNDIIEAGAGDDLIVTGEGADVVFGNAGDDRIVAGDGDLTIDLEGENTLDLTDYVGLTQSSLEITQYRAPDGDIYLNFHVRDDLNPGVTPATGGVSVQYGEIGNFASVTVSNGAEGTVELSYEELMAQYAAHGLVYSGTAAAELLIGTQHGDTFFGGAGADTIRAGAGDDKFDGGAGDDLLEGGAGNDTYLLGYNRGRDTVAEDGVAERNATHTILLDAGIPSSLVYARQSGNDLEVRLRATGDALVLKDFYLQPQSWQDGWQVRDSNSASTDLADYVPVIPPQAASPDAGFDDVVQACRIAEIHETIEKLPKGYNTEIGEHGLGLSGGQKQRLAIARAMLKRPKVLAFDEATSGLDQSTAERFAHTVNKVKSMATVLFIAHQVPKALSVDEVASLGADRTIQMRVVEEDEVK